MLPARLKSPKSAKDEVVGAGPISWHVSVHFGLIILQECRYEDGTDVFDDDNDDDSSDDEGDSATNSEFVEEMSEAGMPPIPRPSTPPLPNAFRGASASISEKTSFHTGDTGSLEHAPSSSAGRLMMGKNHGVCHVSAANLPQGYNALPSSSTSLANGVKRLRDLMLRFMCVLLRDVRRHLIPLTEVQDQEPDMSLSAIFNLERYLHH